VAISSDGIYKWNGRQQIGNAGGSPSYVRGVDSGHYLYFSAGGNIYRITGVNADEGARQKAANHSRLPTCSAHDRITLRHSVKRFGDQLGHEDGECDRC